MSNIPVNITLPDPLNRFILEGYDRFGEGDNPSREQVAAAFQEIVNHLAVLFSGNFRPDENDAMHFRTMEENLHCWGELRQRTPEAEKIGKRFLLLLDIFVRSPAFKRALEDEGRRGDDPPEGDPGGGMRSPHEMDDDPV